MPDLKTYLKYRTFFLQLGKNIEVQKLDIYYKLNFLYDKKGNCIRILETK